MGAASSCDISKAIFLDINGSIEKIVFSNHSSVRDVQELICQAGKADRSSTVALRSADGAYITVSPTMPCNTEHNPYIAEISPAVANTGEAQQQSQTGAAQAEIPLVNTVKVLERLADQVSSRSFMAEDIKKDLIDRINCLEKRMDVEGLKSVEVEKCQRTMEAIKDQIYEAQKKFIGYNRLSVDIPRAVLPRKSVSAPHYVKYTLSQETIEYLKKPTFDIWHWEPNEMLSLLEHMYHELGLDKEFSINGVTLKKWLLCIQESYRNNPFHNFCHCFCVTQMMYGMIHLCKLHEKISKEDIGILITACICHDLDHPGYNNTYQINAKTELAIRYNDISPLENHHCAVAFRILADPETNIFSNVDSDTFKRIRAGITTLILATDMARHAEILENFKICTEDGFDIENKAQLEAVGFTRQAFSQFLACWLNNSGIITLILATDMARHSEIMEKFKERVTTFDYEQEDDLLALKMILIKCCDISNEVRPMEVSEPWLDCLLEEYFNQSDKEKAEGLPVAPFMDREKVTKPTAQIGFIKFVLIPMFQQVAKIFPQLTTVMVEPLIAARDHWEQLKQEDDQREKQAA